MEAAAIARHTLPRLSSDTGVRFPIKSHPGFGDYRVSVRRRRIYGRLSCQFSDCGSQQYYVSPRKETKQKEKEKSFEIKSVKKKLKFIKRLSNDLSLFSLEAFDKENASSLMNEEKNSEAVEVLHAQLLQLRSEQKELKRRVKENKSQNKTTMKQTKGKCKSSSSSSSSSESSDSDNGEVIGMMRLRSDVLRQSKNRGFQTEIKETILAEPASSLIQQEKLDDRCLRSEHEYKISNGWINDRSNNIVERTSSKRIEVCMGGKCKKSGAGALLEEFERKAGAECAVSTCKCLGKCRDGPNLRVSNTQTEDDPASRIQGYAGPPMDSLCIGVGLEDVDMILAKKLGKDMNENLMVASS